MFKPKTYSDFKHFGTTQSKNEYGINLIKFIKMK